MDREQAIKELQESHDIMRNHDIDESESYLMQALNMAIKALEQEPCEDAISRQAVHEAITRWAGSMSVLIALPTREVRPLLESIHKLPSVKPQENTGHWIYKTMEGQFCSICDEQSVWKFNYCPYCGVKMVEEQERSDKK